MQIYIIVKSLSRRRPMLAKTPWEIPEDIADSTALICRIVEDNVKEHNEMAVDTPLLSYLTEKELEDMETTGKISFRERKNENQQDLREAIDNALQCWEDGIFRVFINDQEIEKDKKIKLQPQDELVFVRLTMLAGRLW